MTNNPRVIVIGGGFGGINAAKNLKKAEVEVLLIDKANHHLFQPLLYQVATAALSPGNIAVPLRDILAHQPNASVILSDIVKIEKEKSEIVSANGEIFKYDFLIVAPGASHSYFGHSEWEILAPGLKTIPDALRIRELILLSYERAERSKTPEEIQRFLKFVVIGGGPTGVEMAGAIAEIAQRSLVKNFRQIKPEQTKVYLIEGMDHVLPTFPHELGEKALKDLQKLGVEVLLNSIVTKMSADGVWIGEKFIETPNIIWAAGNAASPLLKTLNTPLDKCGRVIVKNDLTIEGYSNIFVIGDASCYLNCEGTPLPGIATVAIQQGQYVANLIRKKLTPEKRPPFKYFNKGIMATIGRGKAVAVIGKTKISGIFAWLSWCFIHILYLISFPNRVVVMIDWFYLYLRNKRRFKIIENTITENDEPMHIEKNKVNSQKK